MSKDIWTTQDTVSLPQHQPLDTLSVHDLSRLRQIITTTIADGWQCGKGCDLRHPWSFNSADTDLERNDAEFDKQRREQFIETIITRIIATAAPSLREESK